MIINDDDDDDSLVAVVDDWQSKSGALQTEELSPGVSQLVISDVNRSYAGQLSCFAHNDAGSTSNDFTVVVHCKQKFTSEWMTALHAYFACMSGQQLFSIYCKTFDQLKCSSPNTIW